MTFFMIKCVCVYLSGIGFGLIVNLPHKALNIAGINATIGWLVYYWILTTWGGLGAPNFFWWIGNWRLISHYCPLEKNAQHSL